MIHIDVYFDYASPFAYIASERLERLLAGRAVEIRWKPIELEALSNYSNGLPYSAVKRRYVVIDAVRSAEFHGVRIQIPKPHPVLSQKALEISVRVHSDSRFGALRQALFRAAWRHQSDLSSDDVLRDCIVRAGGEVDAWLPRADQKPAIDRLNELTAEAEARGVFGVPSFLLGDELFWGLDSLPTLQWRLDKMLERPIEG